MAFDATRGMRLLLLTVVCLIAIVRGDHSNSRLLLNSTHTADRHALIGMLSAISFEASQNSRPWDSSVDPCGNPTCNTSVLGTGSCNWDGITCKDFRVVSLELPGRRLTGRISGHVCRFEQLRRLDLSGNSLSGLLPHLNGCQDLPHIQSIDLSDNQLSGPLPFAFASLPELRMLNLSRNSFSGSIPRIWGEFGRLEVIDLSRNDITGSIPESLAVLQSLKLLILDYNCRICGQLAKQFRERVVISTIGTNIGSWMCRFEDCHQSTSVFIAQIAVSVSAVFCFLGACFITKFLRRFNNDLPVTAATEPEIAKAPPHFMECVGSLVLMPGDINQIFVALPLSQELPRFANLQTLDSDRLYTDGTTSRLASDYEVNVDVVTEAGNGSNAAPVAEDIRISISEGRATEVSMSVISQHRVAGRNEETTNSGEDDAYVGIIDNTRASIS